MALKKTNSGLEGSKEKLCNSSDECYELYYQSEDFDEKIEILNTLACSQDGILRLVDILKDTDHKDKRAEAHIAALLSKLEPKSAPIDNILEILKAEKAYTRNLAISILQDYGKEIKYYIVKYLIGDDRDLRIFAINVLGDVNFPESRDMLLELLESEEDVNVAMTAVDYLSEIGIEEDIPMLEKVKKRFKEEPYVLFAINRAINSIKA